jgi:hypothetical protein
VRGYLTGDNPKVNDKELTSDLINNLDMLEEADFKLFQAIGCNGYNPITGVEMLDSVDTALDVKGLVTAIIQYRHLVSNTQKAYNNELSSAIKIAKSNKGIAKSALYNHSIDIAILTLKEAKKRKTKAEKSHVKRSNAIKKAKEDKHKHLTTLFIQYIKEYVKKFPNKLNKNVHKKGAYTYIKKLVFNNLAQDNFKVYYDRTNSKNEPSISTYKRHFKKSLSLMGLPRNPS